MKKKILALILLLAICAITLSLVACKSGDEEDSGGGTLTIYNCEDYIDESVLDSFEEWYFEQTGKSIETNYICYDTNETMMTKVMNDDANVDVICTSEYGIQKLWNNGYLLPISKTEGMNTINPAIYERTASKFGADFEDYFVPYMYGTLGILYNVDKFEENEIDIEEEGWSILWNDGGYELLEDKVLMKDSIRDTFAAGAMYLKEQGRLPEKYIDYSVEDLINCTDDEFVAAVKEVLIEQKDTLLRYEVDFGKDDLINLHAYVDLAWSGDAMYAIEEAESLGVTLDYYVPESGANVWFDGWFIPTCTTNESAATYFIEYMCKPEISMANMVYVGYSSAVHKEILMENEEALAILEDNEYDPEEFFSWEVRYPDINNPNYGMMTEYGEANAKMTIMWEEVKAATDSPIWQVSLIALGAIAGAVGLAVLIYFLVRGLKRDRRYK